MGFRLIDNNININGTSEPELESSLHLRAIEENSTDYMQCS